MVSLALMALSDWIQLMIAIPTACLFLAAMVRWFYKVASRVAAIYREMTPNGGKSIKDRIARTEATINDHTRELRSQSNELRSQSDELKRQTVDLKWIRDTLSRHYGTDSNIRS